MRRPAVFVRPLLIAVAAVAMLYWTWGTWPDPLVDYGTQLYTAWQVSRGRVLYRDVAFYGGPLSTYVNAALFRLFGVGLHTLEAANLAVLATTMAVTYRLTVRASGPAAAVVGGVTFAAAFAFGQGVGLGNYNWVTPYTHELTHGLLLATVAVACLDRFARTQRLPWAVAAGVATGATFLTKIEPATACLAAVGTQAAALAWTTRPSPRRAAAIACALLVPAVGMVAIAILALTAAMPVPDAVRGVLGAWRWALDRRITGLTFYRGLVGLDDVAGNLLRMAQWSVAAAAVFGAATALALMAARWGRSLAAVAGVVTAVGLGATFHRVDWPAALVPLPAVLCLAGASAAVAVARRRTAPPGRLALRLALVAFSLALLGKMLLRTHAYHYGFALAMPGTLVAVAIVAEELPAWVDRSGGRGAVVRAVGLPVWVAFVAATLSVESSAVSFKRWTVMGGGPDAFRASTRGLEVEATVEWIDRHVPVGGTVAVFPQGLMVNYLSRRATPTRYVNFMPPEVIAAGEDVMLAALKANPPDALVIDGSAVRDGQFTLDRQYDWGAATSAWIHAHYRVAEQVRLRPPLPTLYGFTVLIHKRLP